MANVWERVVKSFCAMRVILSYIDPLEQTELQAGNKWFYTVAVSRVQTRINIFTGFIYFTDHGSNDFDEAVLEVKIGRSC